MIRIATALWLTLILQCHLLVNTFDFHGILPVIGTQYIPPPIVSRDILENVENTLWGLLLPIDQQDAVAIFISEGVSGFLGGAAGKVVSYIDGNKNNRQSSIANAESSGAYFGTAAAIRSLASLAGFSSIFVNLFALTTAAMASEIVKVRDSNIVTQRTRVGNGPTMYDLMKFKDPSMLDLMKFAKNEDIPLSPRMKMMGEVTRTEITADLVKYFCIYSIFPKDRLVKLEDAVIIGSVAGIISQLVREQKDREIDDEIRANNRLRNRLKVSNGKVSSAASDMPMSMFPFLAPIIGMLKRSQTSSPSSSIIDTSTTNEVAIKLRPDYGIARFARAALETATQLLTYEAARRYVMEAAPYFQQGIPPLDDLNSLLLSQTVNPF